jgi:hypothetical protein
MIPVLLLFAAMFILIVILGSLFLIHLRDHEKEAIEAEEFAQIFLRRMEEEIRRQLHRDDDD